MPEEADPLRDLDKGLPSPIAQGAIATFEMFLNFVSAGFSEQQALFLTAFIIKPTAGGA